MREARWRGINTNRCHSVCWLDDRYAVIGRAYLELLDVVERKRTPSVPRSSGTAVRQLKLEERQRAGVFILRGRGRARMEIAGWIPPTGFVLRQESAQLGSLSGDMGCDCDGSRLWIGDIERNLFQWDAESGALQKTKLSIRAINLGYLKAHDLLLVQGYQGAVAIFNPTTLEEIDSFRIDGPQKHLFTRMSIDRSGETVLLRWDIDASWLLDLRFVAADAERWLEGKPDRGAPDRVDRWTIPR